MSQLCDSGSTYWTNGGRSKHNLINCKRLNFMYNVHKYCIMSYLCYAQKSDNFTNILHCCIVLVLDTLMFTWLQM